ncbi:helix-turn-helix transcriptional regulator [Clostridium perfringens]|uniref:helix-turn-helix transcriptional regulator n=1 Tax=Clostridium perfringens TaxID=1502 RepID=UPI0018E49185|nr:helix-turn-helix transcriptional regulator [Clostridium perfringens]ELC8451126.1 helix-turn-helix transcriptional regulator [Clostridium perfringens]MBI6029311.1 helix-turn-helix transcriptional regulator [Clostridium perfringens]MBI6034103.1 helix-turn-helix transcriptional regulator [Clostridium perfringens]
MNNLKMYRKFKGITQTELSIKSGISVVTISKIETIKNYDVSKSTMIKLAVALDTTVQELFFSDEE